VEGERLLLSREERRPVFNYGGMEIANSLMVNLPVLVIIQENYSCIPVRLHNPCHQGSASAESPSLLAQRALRPRRLASREASCKGCTVL
jgi:hypothetical protein